DYCGGELESNTLEGYNAANPHNPLRVVSRYSGGELHGGGGESEQCEHYIHGMPHMTHPGDNAVAMYYHWYADYLLGWWAGFEGREHEDHVVIVDRDAMTTRNGLFSQYGLFSRHECYRYRSELKENTCFTMVKQPVTTARDWTDFASWALQRLEIKVQRPTESHVGIISRSFKRFLLNEQELLHATLQMNVSAELLLFDTLPFYQQVQALRRTTVLVGMHGSGLTNALYLQRGAVLLQIMPFKTGGGAAAYQGFTHGAGAVYKEWTNPCQECTVMHWDILNEQEKADKAGILERGGWSAGGSLYFWFWVNQETYVDPKKFQALIRDALSADYLHAPRKGGAHHYPWLRLNAEGKTLSDGGALTVEVWRGLGVTPYGGRAIAQAGSLYSCAAYAQTLLLGEEGDVKTAQLKIDSAAEALRLRNPGQDGEEGVATSWSSSGGDVDVAQELIPAAQAWPASSPRSTKRGGQMVRLCAVGASSFAGRS
ncbi:uncharacterized protein ACA1_077520, partial [Acanthamoeba castellanii str. Neff]